MCVPSLLKARHAACWSGDTLVCREGTGKGPLASQTPGSGFYQEDFWRQWLLEHVEMRLWLFPRPTAHPCRLSPCCSDPVIVKDFERVVLKHFNDNIPVGLDSHLFSYKRNRSRVGVHSTPHSSYSSPLSSPSFSSKWEVGMILRIRIISREKLRCNLNPIQLYYFHNNAPGDMAGQIWSLFRM